MKKISKLPAVPDARKMKESLTMGDTHDKRCKESGHIATTCPKSKGFDLALYNISATVAPSNLDPTASTHLQIGWVQVLNVPGPARVVEAVTLIAELAGEVVVVDEVSLIKEGPVTVKLNARNIANLRGCVEIFIEKVGYEIQFVPEGIKEKLP
uniref:Uncharacterized protein n=1 Tax=Setaria italica TaxID=4555 RepID=K3Y1U8_SETIT